ncbi:prenyltransferase [Companilactobacillus metriopterae]|uniref:prenyltransferase n=1 Tax=Companilactobacillus metriopterae TaxID=1909267 RepID=UPI001F50D0FA|nr:prenyltransferase [Companilactobacillus metriopterae]
MKEKILGFLTLVQIYSVVTSVMPFLLGALFVATYYQMFNWGYSILLLVAEVFFHLAVNTHNQYVDYFHFKSDPKLFANSYNNTLVRHNITPRFAIITAYTLAGISGIIGIYLTVKTGWFLLLIGVLSFIVGYFYSGGKHSISYTPFGEFASGITMGYFITLITVYINIANTPQFENIFWLKTLLISLISIFAISNVMLANNIADLDEDLKINRKTIVAYIGVKNSMILWVASYVLGYLAIVASIILGYLPWYCLIFLVLTFPMVYKKTMEFVNKPDKATTFVNSIMNAQILLLAVMIGCVIDLFI